MPRRCRLRCVRPGVRPRGPLRGAGRAAPRTAPAPARAAPRSAAGATASAWRSSRRIARSSPSRATSATTPRSGSAPCSPFVAPPRRRAASRRGTPWISPGATSSRPWAACLQRGPADPRRPLAVVACDDAGDPARVATHLVDDLRVPAIVGFYGLLSQQGGDRSGGVALRPAGGCWRSPPTRRRCLRAIPSAPGQPRLVWRTTTSTDMVQAPVAALLSEVIEPELRATPGLLAPGEPIRVLFARVANATGLSAADGYVSTLRFNGKSVAENGESFASSSTPIRPTLPRATRWSRTSRPRSSATARTSSSLRWTRPWARRWSASGRRRRTSGRATFRPA